MNTAAREKLGIGRYDSADYLRTQQDMAQYFEACLEMGEPALIQEALGAIARARGMGQLAKDTGLTREGLYRSLSAQGNPEFSTIMRVISALGLTLHATPALKS